MGRNEVHCHKPLAERNLGVLKDCSNENGELVSAMAAKIASVTTFVAMGAAAIWADSVSVRPTLFRNGLFADFIGVEIVGDLDKGGEVVKLYHSESLLFYIYL